MASDPVDEIKRLYYTTTRQRIQDDFDRAIDLLKAMADESQRERAVVYMEGLAEMRKEWQGGGSKRPRPSNASPRSGTPPRSSGSKSGR